jgi:hypothetical protein
MEKFEPLLGCFGNLWIRQNFLEFAGEQDIGHTHTFDHLTLLTSGKVSVKVDGFDAKEFTAPTFIVIKKQYRHQITALTDNVNWFCIFSVLGLDGNPVEDIDIYNPAIHDPTWSKNDPFDMADYVEEHKNLTTKTML